MWCLSFVVVMGRGLRGELLFQCWMLIGGSSYGRIVVSSCSRWIVV